MPSADLLLATIGGQSKFDKLAHLARQADKRKSDCPYLKSKQLFVGHMTEVTNVLKGKGLSKPRSSNTVAAIDTAGFTQLLLSEADLSTLDDENWLNDKVTGCAFFRHDALYSHSMPSCFVLPVCEWPGC